MASPTPLGVHQIASGEPYALVEDLNRVGITADAAMTFVKARAEYLTDKAVADAGALSRQALNELPRHVASEVDRVIGDTREDAAEARSIAQQAYEYNQALVAPAAAVINAVVTDPATESGALVAGKVDKGEQVHNVMDYGARADGVTDDSAALIAARDAAIGGRAPAQGSMPLVVPAGMTLYINTVVDLRYIIDLRIEGRVNVGPNGLLVIGHTSAQKPGQRIHIRQAMHATADQTNPCVRIVGMKQAQVSVLRCDYLEMLADSRTNAVTDGSISYNEITLGRVNKLHLRGEGSIGWITENNFNGGDIKDLVVSGAYNHNQNRWNKPCFEGGSIDFQAGSRNLMLDARCESGTTVRFGPGTDRNVLVDNFVTNALVRSPGAVVVEDAGYDNVVMGTPDAYLTATPLVHIDAASTILDGCRDTAGATLVPGLDKLGASAWAVVIDTGVIPIRETVEGFNGQTYEGSWTMNRFEVSSDAKCWRPYVELFDASGAAVTDSSSVLGGGGWAFVGGSWTIQTDKAATHLVITDKRVTHARFRVRASPSPVPFRFLRLNGFTARPGVPTGADRVRRQVARPLYQTTRPTKGVAHPGTRVEGPNGGWVATNRADTTATGSAAGTISVRVASTTGMAAGDVIGLVLTDGTTHWTTVASTSDVAVHLAEAIPLGVPAGAPVATTRWTA